MSWAGRIRRSAIFAPALLIAIGGWVHRWINEDAYINLRVVEQIFAGHGPVFNAGERVEVGTSPLWIAVLVVARLLFGWLLRDEWIAVLASLIAAVAAFAIAAIGTRALHRDEDSTVVPIGLVLVAGVAVVWDFSTSGLEMGLVWLWIAASWFVLVTLRDLTDSPRRRTLGAVVIGLGPLVRPDLGLMMACFIAAWFLLAPTRRVRRDLLAMFALPVAYQIFRMGYYANLVPNTAFAKDADGLHLRQGWNYLFDFVDSYALWLTVPLMAAVLVVRARRDHDRRRNILVLAMVGGAALHGAYIVAVGGDYMHGRLLLPACFALAVPASTVVRERRSFDASVAALAGLLALVSVVWFRPPPNPPGAIVAQITDYRTLSGATMTLEEETSFGLTGRQAHQAYADGVRGYFDVEAKTPAEALDPDVFILTLGSIGAPAYHAGRRVYVVDIGGLAEPLAARAEPIPGRPAGHRKQVDDAWYDARFAAPTPDDSAAVIAARHALECGDIRDLIHAVDADLTPGLFLSNIVDSFGFTTLSIPYDPVAAESQFC